MTYRYRQKNRILKKSIGLVLAASGVGILVQYMPGWLWPLLIGFGLVTLGWMLFYSPK